MIEIRIDVDRPALMEETPETRLEFQTWLFSVGSIATAEYGADVDFSDAHHWIIRVPEQHEKAVRRLLLP